MKRRFVCCRICKVHFFIAVLYGNMFLSNINCDNGKLLNNSNCRLLDASNLLVISYNSLLNFGYSNILYNTPFYENGESYRLHV